MPVLADFQISQYSDGVLTISMTPPVNVSNWSIEFSVTNRFGGETKLITKSFAPGFNIVSGITMANAGQGIFNVGIKSVETSGLEYGSYAYVCERLSSGSRTMLSQGYLVLTP